MPQVCVAYGCTNSSHSRYKEKNKEENITFHRFPLDAKQRALWVQAVRRKDWEPSKTAVLCSKHFQESSMDRTSLVRVRLREGAKPEIFPSHPPHLRKVTKNRRPLKRKDLEERMKSPSSKEHLERQNMKFNEVSDELQNVKSNFEDTKKNLGGKVSSLQLKEMPILIKTEPPEDALVESPEDSGEKVTPYNVNESAASELLPGLSLKSPKPKSRHKRKTADTAEDGISPEKTLKLRKYIDDTCDTFGKHVAAELRKYDSHKMVLVKKAIMDIIFQADMEMENIAGLRPGYFSQPYAQLSYSSSEYNPSAPSTPSPTEQTESVNFCDSVDNEPEDI